MSQTPKLTTRFTQTYDVKHPIVAAGMAFVTLSPRLPVAVSNAGALGSFAAGILPIEVIRENIRAIRQQTSKPLNLNIITLFSSNEHIDLCIEEQVDIVSFNWRHPKRTWIKRLHDAGIKVWEQVGTPDAAKRAVDDGVELIIAQGAEAGGHCYGVLPVFVAVPAIVDAVDDTMVLAAGGIADGRGLAAALSLGADGVWVGTRLIATEEADVADEYKASVVNAGPTDTRLTSMFGSDMPEFNPMRVIANRIVKEWDSCQDKITQHAREEVVGNMPFMGNEIQRKKFSSLMPVRGSTGDFEQMALPAGQGLNSIKEILPAAEVINRMISEAAEMHHKQR